MLYLAASEQIQTFEDYKGEKGRFAEVFAISDRRNKNGWRVTWQSIKDNIKTALGMPGIEYEKCSGGICDLDHTDGATFRQAVDAQEDYRISTIVDFKLDEATHRASFIMKFADEGAYERVKSGELKYVSPSVWPASGSWAHLGTMPNGLPMLDVYEWKFLHTAFVTKPAFGDEAKVTATCEGEGCQMHLMSAAEKIAAEDELAPIKTVPILLRHKNRLVWVSVTEEEAEKISELDKVIESEIIPVLKANTSFTSCSCTSAHKMDKEESEKKVSALTKANEEKDEKIKDLESKLRAMEEEDKKKKEAKKGMEEDEEDEEKEKPQAKKARTVSTVVDGENKAQNAKIAKLEAKLAEPLIAKMVEARKGMGGSDADLQSLETSLKAKSFEEVESIYNNEKIFIENLTAKEGEERVHFDFLGNTVPGALAGKSLEDVLGEGTA